MSKATPEFAPTIFEDGFLPEDESTKALYDEVGAFAKQGQPIIIFGPTGAGKEFLARHYYKVLINTDFYQEYKENWKTNFSKIQEEYSEKYKEQALNIFLRSIKAGIFQSINAATIYPKLAESILFGNEENAFTDAITNPGLLESIKYGVLFIDEVGELPKALQAKFLRAVDSEIREGSRMNSKVKYSLKDLIIISATNQPRKKLRKDFYYRLGIDVEIKGIDERQKDVRISIPYFIRKAIGKRKDRKAIIETFCIKEFPSDKKLSETEEIYHFAKEQSALVVNDILMRKWRGNFRALRMAIEASILRIESPRDVNKFSREFRNHLNYYMAKYSEENIKVSTKVGKTIRTSIYPSSNPNMDRRILEEINDRKIFQNMEDFEKHALAVFLSLTNKNGFKRKEMQDFYKNKAIKYNSDSHIRGRINQLVALKILNKTGKGKSRRYQLAKSFLAEVTSNDGEIFSLPKVGKGWLNRDIDIASLDAALLNTERIYIQAPPGYGKTAFIALFCDARKSLYNFYYYPLGEAGIRKLFKDMSLQSINIHVNVRESIDDLLNNIHPHLSKLFEPSERYKPVLILDHVHYISNADDKRILVELSKKWKEIILILIGNKMDNIFLEDFYEFNLRPWGKQT